MCIEKLSLRESPLVRRTKNDDVKHGKTVFRSCDECLSREQSAFGHIKGEVSALFAHTFEIGTYDYSSILPPPGSIFRLGYSCFIHFHPST